ncbi:MAG TPA: hypothetical protein VE487_09665, partial [Ilumatobacter sp.]|nr:hypothetical protein [Ilumatobacter sp.]
DALSAINLHTTNQLGMTAIGDGIEAAANQLALATTFTSKATVVFTDGHETEPKYISDVTDLVTSTVFAIGLGTADQLNPVALDDIVNDTGGYLLLTGNPGNDDLLLLQKYFAQVIAGVSNNQIVVDPDGFVPVGGSVDVPFDLNKGDTRCDAILLSRAADAINAVLIAPDGTQLDAANGVTYSRTANHQVLRLALPSPKISSTGGRWCVRLRVDRRGLTKHLNRLKKTEDTATIDSIGQHGLPFTVTVQARTNVHLDVATHQSSRLPGGNATIRSTLTDFGIPLTSAASVVANVRQPNGATSTIALTETDSGTYEAAVPTLVAGVYRVLVTASGTTLHGEPFRREQVRTLAVWNAADDQPPSTGTGTPGDWCDLLKCLVGSGALDELAKRSGIDLAAVEKCLRSSCADRR